MKHITYFLTTAFAVLFVSIKIANAQGSVGINTKSPNSNAALDIQSIGKQGILIPRLSGNDTLVAPLKSTFLSAKDKGLLFYDTIGLQFLHWNGVKWQSFGKNSGGAGLQGPIGPTGATGAAGPQGAVGATGAQGPAGNNGAAGVQGPIGLTGATGAAGPQGAVGVTGAQGPTGNNGATGAQGPIGLTGNDGIDGLDGNTILNGIINPVSTTGIDGDFYLNTITNNLFGPKNGGVWSAGVNLIGTNGLNGKTILNGNIDPIVATGTIGDFYINTASNKLFGPKSAGVWPAGVSLIGPAGSFAVTGTLGQTIYNDGTAWKATSNLYNDGSTIGIGTPAISANKLLIKSANSGTIPFAVQNSIGTNSLVEIGDFSGSGVLRGFSTLTPLIGFSFNAIASSSSYIMSNLGIGVNGTIPEKLTINGNAMILEGKSLKFVEPTGLNFSSFKATTQAADISYTLPATIGNLGDVLVTDNAGNLSWASIPGLTSGTTNYIPKWTSATTLSSTSLLYDNGTKVGIGTTNPLSKMHIAGGLRVDSLGNGISSQVVFADPNGHLISQPISSLAWSVQGNTGTSAVSNFIGTTDSQNLVFKTNNILSGLIDQTANGSTTFGYSSGASITTGTSNTAFGYRAGEAITTGSTNTAIGNLALNLNTTGAYNTALGYHSLRSNITGGFNTALGRQTLQYNTGSSNTAVGYAALGSLTNGNNNTAVGYNAMFFNRAINAGNNTAVGFNALYGGGALNTHKNATAIGYSAGYNNIGDGNTFVGDSAGYENTSGKNNIFIGVKTGLSNTSGSCNIFIGDNADVGSPSINNSIAIGRNAIVNTNNSIALGGIGINAVKVGIGTSSPTFQLSLNGAATDADIQLANALSGSSGADGLRINFSGINANIINYENGGINLGTNGSDRIRIKPTGEVQITNLVGQGSVLSDASGNLSVNKSAFLVYFAAPISIPKSTLKILIYNKTIYDISSEFDLSKGVYKAPTNGIFHFDAAVGFPPSATYDDQYEIGIYVNGILEKRNSFRSGTVNFTLTISADLKLSANDLVDIRVKQEEGTKNTLAGSTDCTFSGHRIF